MVRTMRKLFLILTIMLSVLFNNLSPALSQITATVDRTQIALDETMTLSITKEGASINLSDLKPIEKDFQVVSRSQGSSTLLVNGSLSTTYSLDLVLAPKRAGVLYIPAITDGNDKTATLAIKVVSHAQTKTRDDNAPFFIETEVDKDTAFVQSQIIYTLRIFWSGEISVSEPADPKIDNALLERLGDATFTKAIEGRNFKVFERRFAIFPQKSGTLEIPQTVVQATIPVKRRQRNIYDMFGSAGKQIKLRSERRQITVKEIADGYPNAAWLPTEHLGVKEKWSSNPGELKVGESATVTITITGDGLLGAQLPEIELPDREGIKLYQGKAEVSNQLTGTGVTGSRQESIALIPTSPGTVNLPEIRIPWWSQKEARIEYATIPSRQLLIKDGTNGNDPADTGSEIPITRQLNTPAVPTGAAATLAPGHIKMLLAGAILVVCGWLITFILLLKARRHLRALQEVARKEQTARLAGEDEAFKELVRTCRSGDPSRARQALINWTRLYSPDNNIQTTSDLNRIYPDSRLGKLLADIDSSLYSPDKTATEWQGQHLLREAEKIRKEGRHKRENNSPLQSLYR